MVDLSWMSHPHAAIHRVAVASTFSLPRDVSGLHEVRNDSLRSSLRDADLLGNVTKPRRRVALEAQEHLRVAR